MDEQERRLLRCTGKIKVNKLTKIKKAPLGAFFDFYVSVFIQAIFFGRNKHAGI
jgi:hypothetical protein